MPDGHYYTPRQHDRIERSVVFTERYREQSTRIGGELHMPTIIVRPQSDIDPFESGDAVLMKGAFDDLSGTNITLTVWNLSLTKVEGQEDYVAVWVTSDGSNGGWGIVSCCGGQIDVQGDPYDCGCFSTDTVCRIWLAIGSVSTTSEDWPDYCNSRITGLTVADSDYLDAACESCNLWNDQIELFPESFQSPSGDDCSFGVKNTGSTLEVNYPDNWLFPCHEAGDDAYMELEFNNPTCTEATLTILTAADNAAPCQMLEITFEDLDFSDEATIPSGSSTQNRMSYVSLLEEGACWCTVLTSRVNGDEPAAGHEALEEGDWDPTNIPPDDDLQHGTGTDCHWYVATAAGSHDFGDGAVSIAVGDIIIYEGTPINRWRVISVDDRDHTFALCEILDGGAVDRHGCDWSQTFQDGAIVLQFEQCSLAASQAASQSLTVITSEHTPYTVQEKDVTILVDTSGAAVEIDLPPLADNNQRILHIQKSSANTTGSVTIDGDGAETVYGSATQSLSNQDEGVTIQGHLVDANWIKIGEVS